MSLELMLFLVLPVVFLAACALLRVNFPAVKKFNWLPLSCFSILLVGSVLGHDFFHVSVGPFPITLDRLLLGTLLLLFAWQVFNHRQQLTRLNFVDVFILGWLAVISFSTFSNDYTIMDNGPLSRLLFFNYLPVMLYFLIRWVRLEVEDLKVFAAIMVVFGLYLALTGVAETRDLSVLVFPKYIMTSETTEFFGRGRGPFLNPVTNGIFMAVCISCTLMWWPRTTSVRGRFAILAITMVIAFGVYSTFTRSTWLSLIAGMGAFVFWPSNRQQKGLMIVAATVVAIVSFPVIGHKIFSFKRDKEISQAQMEKSAELRPYFVEIAWDMFKDRPALGVGFAQYAKAKYPYLQGPHTTEPLRDTRTLMQHNVFLGYLVDTGVVGLSMLMCLLATGLLVSWRVWHNRKLDLWARQFALANVVLLAGYSVNGMFHDVSIIPMMHMLVFFWLGMVNNIYSRPDAFRKNEAETTEAEAQGMQAIAA